MAHNPNASAQSTSELNKSLKLVYTREEIEANHSYAKSHLIDGELLHGGFDESGQYIAPRTLHRRPAVDAWRDQLKKRGSDIIDPVWENMLKWHAHDAQLKARDKSLEKISTAILELKEGESLLREFNSMTTVSDA